MIFVIYVMALKVKIRILVNILNKIIILAKYSDYIDFMA